jgi:hypothetical protein
MAALLTSELGTCCRRGARGAIHAFGFRRALSRLTLAVCDFEFVRSKGAPDRARRCVAGDGRES